MVDASKYITIPLAAAMRLVADRVIYKPGDRVGNTKSKRTGTVIHTRPDDHFARGHFLVAVKWDIDPNHPQWNTPNNRNFEIYDSYLYLLQPELNFPKESAYKFKPGDRIINNAGQHGTVRYVREKFMGYTICCIKWDDPAWEKNKEKGKDGKIWWCAEYLQPEQQNLFDPKTAAIGKDERELRKKFAPGTKVKTEASGPGTGTVTEILFYTKLRSDLKVIVTWDNPSGDYDYPVPCPWWVNTYPRLSVIEAQGELFDKSAAIGKEERELRKKFAPGTKVKLFIRGTCGGTYDFMGTVKELKYVKSRRAMEVGVIWDHIPDIDWWYSHCLVPVEPQGELFDPKTAAIGKDERELRKKFAPGTRVCWDTDHTQEGTITEILAKAQHSNTLILKVKWDIWDKIYTVYSESLIPLAQQRNLFNPIASQGTVKTAISLPDIVRQTNQFSKKYRPGCTPTLIDSNPKNLSLHYNVKCNKEDSDPAGHDVRVQFDVTKVENSQRANDLDVKCNCSCPAFLMWGAQWNLHQRDGLLPPTRPLLQAPKERLDLRGNYVICKHIHCVFERILPSVQHNIVKILREREIRSKKDRVEEIPQELQEKQKEMKEKRELEKIHDTKDKKIKDRLLQKLQDEEETRLLHEKELEEKGNEPPEDEIQRDQPATEPVSLEEEEETTPAWMRLPEHYEKVSPEDEEVEAIQDLTQQEEAKIEQLHEENKPHLHKGLPYDVDEDPDEIKGKGWKGKRLSSTRQKFRIGDKVIAAVWSNNRRYWEDVNGEVKSAFWSKKQSTYIYLIKYKNSDLTANPDNEMETVYVPEICLTPIQQELNFGKTSSMYAFRIGDKVTFQGFLTHKWFVGEVIERKKEKGWRAGKRDWNNSYLITWIGEGPSGCSRSWLSERHLSSTQQELFKESSTKWKFRVGDYVVRKEPLTSATKFQKQCVIPGKIKEITFIKRGVICLVAWTEPELYEGWVAESNLNPAQQELFKEGSTKHRFRKGDKVTKYNAFDQLMSGTVEELQIDRDIWYAVRWDETDKVSGALQSYIRWELDSTLMPAQQSLFKNAKFKIGDTAKFKFKVGDRVRHMLDSICIGFHDNWNDPEFHWEDSDLGEKNARLLENCFPPVQRELFEEV